MRRRLSATRLCLVNEPKTKEEENRETCADGRIPSFTMDGENKVNVCDETSVNIVIVPAVYFLFLSASFRPSHLLNH